jgi:hypothetical protein
VYTVLNAILTELSLPLESLEFIEGGAAGADSLAREVAHDMGIVCYTCPADWGRYGRGAGMIRNQEMLDIHSPHLVVAFPGGRGTANMVRLAKKDYVEVIEV